MSLAGENNHPELQVNLAPSLYVKPEDRYERPQKVLTHDQQIRLTEKKNQLRVDNELYLRKHPEIKHIVSYFVNEALRSRPTDIQQCASKLLGDTHLRERVYAYCIKKVNASAQEQHLEMLKEPTEETEGEEPESNEVSIGAVSKSSIALLSKEEPAVEEPKREPDDFKIATTGAETDVNGSAILIDVNNDSNENESKSSQQKEESQYTLNQQSTADLKTDSQYNLDSRQQSQISIQLDPEEQPAGEKAQDQ